METFEKIQVIKEVVTKYLQDNWESAGLNPEDIMNNHIVEIGTSVLCTKWEIGYAGGGFVQSVVDNDLQGAIGRADSTNVRALKLYCQMMYNLGMPNFN